mmetsp:Transcript_13429/g.33893  ORF Transcript_13429/g.33893 Transcript_13429/m.33893 type:complete len:291 (+) Transcript_13429:146-1018(+)
MFAAHQCARGGIVVPLPPPKKSRTVRLPSSDTAIGPAAVTPGLGVSPRRRTPPQYTRLAARKWRRKVDDYGEELSHDHWAEHPTKYRKEKRSRKPQQQESQVIGSLTGAPIASATEGDAAAASEGVYMRASMDKAVGIDFGNRYTGVAISAGGIAPRVYGVLPTPRNRLELAEKIVCVAEQENATSVVVGIPVTFTGSLGDTKSDSKQGRICRNFALAIAQVAASRTCPSLQVLVHDESKTSEGAVEAMSSSRGGRAPEGRVDGVAACLLLSRHFDSPWLSIPVKAPISL